MWLVISGNAQQISLKDQSVQCVVTSPPYWGLRDYGLNGNGIGLEPTPEAYVEKIIEVFREVWRVLRDDGTVWVNLGDSYTSGNRPDRDCSLVSKTSGLTNRAAGMDRAKTPPGLKPKDLCGIPWRVAFALQADGWYLRSDIIWSKPNPMPESVTDRPTKSHEYLFLLSKQERYYFDANAVREEATTPMDSTARQSFGGPKLNDSIKSHAADHGKAYRDERTTNRNLRSVWNIATQPYAEAHFATFPEALVEPCIKAGTSEKGCCPECGSPWERRVEKERVDGGSKWKPNDGNRAALGDVSETSVFRTGLRTESKTLSWQPTCKCGHDKTSCVDMSGDYYEYTDQLTPVPCLVLDPFSGSGTVGVVCLKLGRSFVGLDLKPEYNQMAYKRIHNSGSLFS